MRDAIHDLDLSPEVATMAEEVLAGLAMSPKSLKPKYFYDERGSQLFDRICELEEYYPTRTELGILDAAADEIAEAIGPRALFMEYGSGSSLKTRVLLQALKEPALYVPIDISCDHLEAAAAETRNRFPELSVRQVCADYTGDYELPPSPTPPERRVAFFPGSTIGNFHPEDAEEFLRHVAEVCGSGGSLLIGVDLAKDPAVLEAAYDDSEGVTAEFNLNLLRRLNRELDADFDLDAFSHRASFNAERSRIEMHLVSRADQTVHILDQTFRFQRGESLHTESSYKYTLDSFRKLSQRAGFEVRRTWTDARRWFSVQLLDVRS